MTARKLESNLCSAQFRRLDFYRDLEHLRGLKHLLFSSKTAILV